MMSSGSTVNHPVSPPFPLSITFFPAYFHCHPFYALPTSGFQLSITGLSITQSPSPLLLSLPLPTVNHPMPRPLAVFSCQSPRGGSLPTSRFQLSDTCLSITQFLSQNRKCSQWRPGKEKGAGGCWVLG